MSNSELYEVRLVFHETGNQRTQVKTESASSAQWYYEGLVAMTRRAYERRPKACTVQLLKAGEVQRQTRIDGNGVQEEVL